jgi:prepilin signal peptidase PulO-like enzyme (type II secretory pathway)
MYAISLKDEFAQRLGGPGGLYNLGNALGLLSGLSFHVAAALAVGVTGWAAVAEYFSGSLGATAITLAMLIFFWSGEQYHKAWSHGAPPDARLNRLGEISSGCGALMLGLGLFLMGHPVLAATAGLMHAAGKFGSALPARVQARLPFGPGMFRGVVVASRLPALAAVLIDLTAAWAVADLEGAAASGFLVLCYGLWLKADVALMRS